MAAKDTQDISYSIFHIHVHVYVHVHILGYEVRARNAKSRGLPHEKRLVPKGKYRASSPAFIDLPFPSSFSSLLAVSASALHYPA